LPQGLLDQAIDYALKRWEALNRLVDDGVLEIETISWKIQFGPAQLERKIGYSSAILKPGNGAR
jgi:hypothetical protein